MNTYRWATVLKILTSIVLLGVVAFHPVRAQVLNDVARVSVGGTSACAVTRQGAVWCWGDGLFRQDVGQSFPIARPVPGLQQGVRDISVGDRHACASMQSGKVMCWGHRNEFAQRDPQRFFQDGELEAVTETVVEVPVLFGATQVRANRYGGATCALGANGVLQCLESRGSGLYQPMAIDGTQGVGWASKSVFLQRGGFWPSDNISLYVLGQLCWTMESGASSCGLTLPAATRVTDYQVQVTPLVSPEVNTGLLQCVLTADGRVLCAPLANEPVDGVVVWDRGVVQLAVGGSHVCALLNTGVVQCLGDNSLGQLGRLGLPYERSPVVVPLPERATHISTLRNMSCAVLESGALRCWGGNERDQLGLGQSLIAPIPVKVDESESGPLTGLVAGGSQVCGRDAQQQWWCWGRPPQTWTIGVPMTFWSRPVRQIDWPQGSVGASLQGRQMCTYSAVGQVWCRSVDQPAGWREVMAGGVGIAQLALGAYHGCALTQGGQVACWGRGWEHALGTVETDNTAGIAQAVPGVSTGIERLAAAGSFSCVLGPVGFVRCWGSNSSYQLGRDLPRLKSSPDPDYVAGLPPSALGVAAASGRACAWWADGLARCWGGGLPIGHEVVPFQGVASMHLSQAALPDSNRSVGRACALLQSGALWCQDGAGTAWSQVTELPSDLVEVVAGDRYAGPLRAGQYHPDEYNWLDSVSRSAMISGTQGQMCARSISQGVYCWGTEIVGQGVPLYRAEPGVVRTQPLAPAASASDRVFNYLQSVAPSILFPANSQTLSHQGYRYRAYDQQTYLGAKDGRLYYAGPLMSDGSLADLGELSFWLTRAQEAGY